MREIKFLYDTIGTWNIGVTHADMRQIIKNLTRTTLGMDVSLKNMSRESSVYTVKKSSEDISRKSRVSFATISVMPFGVQKTLWARKHRPIKTVGATKDNCLELVYATKLGARLSFKGIITLASNAATTVVVTLKQTILNLSHYTQNIGSMLVMDARCVKLATRGH